VKKVVSFDFDKTLFFTPEPETGKPIFKNVTGLEWPHRGWWGRRESLDLRIFPIPINPYVYNRYLGHREDPNTYIILATGRLASPKVDITKDVIDVLAQYKLTTEDLNGFDEIHLNPGMDTYDFKSRLFESLIRKHKPDEFIMYDDREEHLIKFATWAQTQRCKVTIIDVVNKKEKTYNTYGYNN
jgi:hypothetical protein